ncbi:MAG: PrsW family intramembrane metalloprotease [Verrucomicrobia bacterium]|nr:PrsW family intramembrane metalloprotease [Verrucomicrobiota bacterium]
MRYFYQDASGAMCGPYTFEELRQLHFAAEIRADTTMLTEDGRGPIQFRELWAREQARPEPASFVRRFAEKAEDDLQTLRPHLLLPWRELKNFQWLDNRKLLSIAAVGLLPLLIFEIGAETGSIRFAYWAMAFYFSVLWAFFFYYNFPAPHITVTNCLFCFFGTGGLSVSVLFLAYQLPPLNNLLLLINAPNAVFRWLGFVFGVGVPEETCKALVLFWLVRRFGSWRPQTMLFYGLMAGLGFGIYEGVDYQSRVNWFLADRDPGEYYLLNLIRLTTLPFLHAIWTGMAGYFIGFAGMYPSRKRGLIIVAVGLPALLHGSYDAMGTTIGGLGCALLSIIALVLYLARSVDLEKDLNERPPT